MPKRLRVLIDARPLVDPRGGGVRCVAEQAVRTILASTVDADWYFVTTGLRKPTLPDWITTNASTQHIHITWPNKIWSLVAMFGAVALDGMAAKQLPIEEGRTKTFDKTIILNLGFTGFLESPYALLMHDVSFKIEPRWFSLKARLWHITINPTELIRRAHQIFSVSETTARDIARIYNVPQKEIRIIKPGVRCDAEDARSEKQEARSDEDAPTHHSPARNASLTSACVAGGPLTTHPPLIPFLLTLGAGNPRKNVATAIKAFEILKRDPAFADLDLIVIGDGKKMREARSEKRESDTHLPLTTHHSPRFLQNPSDSELDTLYRDASIFLCPSWYEGYSLPLHEAARFGTPCIASTDGAHPETAPEGTIFIPPSKPHLWAKAIRDILSSPDRYRTVFDTEQEKPDFSNLIHWLERY